MRRKISRNGKMKQKLLESNVRTLHLTNAHEDTHYYYLPFIAGKAWIWYMSNFLKAIQNVSDEIGFKADLTQETIFLSTIILYYYPKMKPGQTIYLIE